MIINDYFFVSYSDPENWVIPGEPGTEFSVGGYYRREKFNEESYTQTAPIERISDREVITRNGKVYALGKINQDYMDYVKAIKNGVPIIKFWSIEGNCRSGYYLLGYLGSEFVRKKVESQDRNILTFKDGSRYFVHWRDYGPLFNVKIALSGMISDLKYPDDFEMYGDFPCRPRLFELNSNIK